MPELDQNYWNERWENEETGWDIGYASPAIVDFFKDFADKQVSILIPGCGNAYEAEYLAAQGFTNITVLDIAPKAVENLKTKFSSIPVIQVVHGDFFEHQKRYDFMIEQTFFCALSPELRSKYVEKAASVLNPSGKIVGLLFNKIFEKEGPPFGGSSLEYQALFSKLFTIKQMDICTKSIPPRENAELFIEFEKI